MPNKRTGKPILGFSYTLIRSYLAKKCLIRAYRLEFANEINSRAYTAIRHRRVGSWHAFRTVVAQNVIAAMFFHTVLAEYVINFGFKYFTQLGRLPCL